MVTISSYWAHCRNVSPQLLKEATEAGRRMFIIYHAITTSLENRESNIDPYLVIKSRRKVQKE